MKKLRFQNWELTKSYLDDDLEKEEKKALIEKKRSFNLYCV